MTDRVTDRVIERQAHHVSERRRWVVLSLVLIPVFIGALDLTIVSAILPEVLTRLNIPIDTNLGFAAWAVTGYLLAYTVSFFFSSSRRHTRYWRDWSSDVCSS